MKRKTEYLSPEVLGQVQIELETAFVESGLEQASARGGIMLDYQNRGLTIRDAESAEDYVNLTDGWFEG